MGRRFALCAFVGFVLSACGGAVPTTAPFVEPMPSPTPSAFPTTAPTLLIPTPPPTPVPPPTPEPTEDLSSACIESTADDLEASFQVLTTLLMEEQLDNHYKTFAAAKAAAKKPTYKAFFRNNEAYETKNVFFRGEVIQTLYDEPWGGYDCEGVSKLLDGDATVLRVDVTRDSYGFYSDTVYVVYLGTRRILEDDIITFVGYADGLETYETVFGSSVTIPKVVVGKFLNIS